MHENGVFGSRPCENSGYFLITVNTEKKDNYFWDVSKLMSWMEGFEILETEEKNPETFLSSEKYRYLFSRLPLSTVGEIIKEQAEKSKESDGDIRIKHYCIMPNHVHFLLFNETDEEDAVEWFVTAFTETVTLRAGRNVWADYYDKKPICDEAERLRVKKMIKQNPYRWFIKYQQRGNE